jgi:hypothetical protein
MVEENDYTSYTYYENMKRLGNNIPLRPLQRGTTPALNQSTAKYY